MSMVAIFKTQCCEDYYVMGNYSGEREEKQARIDMYPHVACKHGSRPLIFQTYIDQELAGIKSARMKKLDKKQSEYVKNFIERTSKKK